MIVLKSTFPKDSSQVMEYFHSLEVVGRGSETQLQVGGNCNSLIWRIEG